MSRKPIPSRKEQFWQSFRAALVFVILGMIALGVLMYAASESLISMINEITAEFGGDLNK